MQWNIVGVQQIYLLGNKNNKLIEKMSQCITQLLRNEFE